MALIYLIGFMGCGKTTLGKKVANKFKYDFIDLDQLIEKRASLTINEFFTKNGEESFRVFEKRFLFRRASQNARADCRADKREECRERMNRRPVFAARQHRGSPTCRRGMPNR